ncbi:type II toxin-antitoxin system CcdA family antitoxin [Sphingomonas alpina]|uniref:Type II toxin-antitoxin system CcdA family antitoxin n=1 Tax=Sphingomonas alpina TaxID=653931 RepID=A0A7H0LMZ0_9SPHN|nr:type II toxin-antitoxin system CcdA family antitoxin [Sphingomonas alpina]QNQ11043.1 type II toxin-antitoxin system CcdA family antitoxin [Sphingomonas alpina]
MPRSNVGETRTAYRRPTNVSLDAAMIEDAKELGINVSRACEEGLAKQIKAERERRWIEENREAIDGWNAWVAEHGLPLEKYRQF